MTEVVVENTKTTLEVSQHITINANGNSSTIQVENEVPSGAINGSNATFTTVYAFVPESLNVYVNGVRQRAGSGFDYINTSTTTIQFSVSPLPGDMILVDYERE